MKKNRKLLMLTVLGLGLTLTSTNVDVVSLQVNRIIEKKNSVHNVEKFNKTIDFTNYTKGLQYDLSEDGTYYIVSDHGLSGATNVVIPEKYKNLPVKEIANDGFAYRQNMVSIAIPSTIEKIGLGAFNNSGFKEVFFNAKNCADFSAKNWVFYPRIDEKTGKIISNPIDFVVGRDVERLPNRLFFPMSLNPNLTPIVNSVSFVSDTRIKEIGDYTFYNLGIENITLPSTLEKIGNFAFYGTKLESLIVPESLKEIGNHAFDSCVNLKTVNLNENLEKIEYGAFRFCKSLESITINSKLKVLPKNLFKFCFALKNVTLVGIEEIGDSVFEKCESLTSFIYDDNLKTIGNRAFYDCKSLTSLTLKSNLKSIGNEAFYNLYNVNTINYECVELNDLNYGNATFKYLGKNTEVTLNISNKVKVLPSRLFFSSYEDEGTPNIKKINMFEGDLEIVKKNAFRGIKANVTYYGKISTISNVIFEYGNDTFKTINCVKGEN